MININEIVNVSGRSVRGSQVRPDDFLCDGYGEEGGQGGEFLFILLN